jgi:uncharacterized protein (TIGR03000 family)
MSAINWKSLSIGAIVVIALVAAASQAEACWLCGCYYPASVGYTAYYSPGCAVGCDPYCGGSCGWYLGYRPGPIRRLLFGPYRYYYGCSGYGSSCCWDTCCSSVVTVGVTGMPSMATPTEAQKPLLPNEPALSPLGLPSEPEPAVEPPATGPGASNTQESSGLLTIYVPEDAKVVINGLATRSQGVRRQYASSGLKPGSAYRYEIRAEVVRDGKTLTTTRTVILRAGDIQTVAMEFDGRIVEGLASR